jgi:hypothetical protein
MTGKGTAGTDSSNNRRGTVAKRDRIGSREGRKKLTKDRHDPSACTRLSGTPLDSTRMMVSGSFLPSTTYQFRVRAESYSWWYGQSSDDVLRIIRDGSRFAPARGSPTFFGPHADGDRQCGHDLRPRG